jgi:hypothetical protein
MKLKEKFKQWLKNKLIKFLGIDTLEKEIHYISVTNEGEHRKMRDIQGEHWENIVAIKTTLSSVVSVGADIIPPNNYGHHSWAVVCIEGNYNVVKFVDLNGKDMREVLYFLKQYEVSRRVIDIIPRQKYFDNLIKM